MEHVHSMLQLLRCVVNRDWDMIASSHRALTVLFPGDSCTYAHLFVHVCVYMLMCVCAYMRICMLDMTDCALASYPIRCMVAAYACTERQRDRETETQRDRGKRRK